MIIDRMENAWLYRGLLAGAGDFVTARAGASIIFFPDDAHMPGLAHEGAVPALKVVVKALAYEEQL